MDLTKRIGDAVREQIKTIVEEETKNACDNVSKRIRDLAYTTALDISRYARIHERTNEIIISIRKEGAQ